LSILQDLVISYNIINAFDVYKNDLNSFHAFVLHESQFIAVRFIKTISCSTLNILYGDWYEVWMDIRRFV